MMGAERLRPRSPRATCLKVTTEFFEIFFFLRPACQGGLAKRFGQISRREKLGRAVESFHGGVARSGTLRSQPPSSATKVLASGYIKRERRSPFEENRSGWLRGRRKRERGSWECGSFTNCTLSGYCKERFRGRVKFH